MQTNRKSVLFPAAGCGATRVAQSGLTFGKRNGHPWVDQDGTSFGEASSRTQAADPNRRETLRIRTPLPGLRGEAKWLRSIATPWSAKALTREVTFRTGMGVSPAPGHGR